MITDRADYPQLPPMLLRRNESLVVFVAIPFAVFGAAMIALGLWLYASPPWSCAPFSPCPIAPNYYMLPDTFLVTGSILLALSLLIFVPSFLRNRRRTRPDLH